MGLLDKIKADAQKTGQNRGKFIFFREGEKKRVRFLTDMEDGIEVTFHDSFEAGINVPCQEIFHRSCQYCDEEGIRTRSQYAWSVYDYESKDVKIFMFPMNNCSPLGAIAAMYETYGTLLDRDYVISVSGKKQNKTYSVVPMDKNKFRNEKAKPFSRSAFLKMLDKAFPDEHSDLNSDTKEESEDSWDDEETKPTSQYKGKSAKELYKLCKERDLEAVPKKPEKYYINLLEEDDKAHDDWDEEEDELPWTDPEESGDGEDEWEDE